MADLTYEVEIPFVENTGRRCAPGCTGMILGTLMPDRAFSSNEVESLSGFKEDKSTWAAQHLLSLDRIGIEVGWIQDEDLPAFTVDPFAYMRRQIPNEDTFENFIKTNDLYLEAARIEEYLALGLSFEHRPASPDDIIGRLSNGWMVRLEVNGKTLADQPGYTTHAVMVSGFNDDAVRLENPDGLYGSKPKQLVTWDRLSMAWDEPTMQYCRLKPQL